MKSEIREYLPTWTETKTLCVTLTMKQYLCGAHRGEMSERLDKIKASQNLRHFLNLLARSCYGSAVQRRYRRKIEVIPILERSPAGRLHYHLTIGNPSIHPKIFRQKIKDCWEQTRWSDSSIDIQKPSDVAGWNNYITKNIDRRSAHIDWENYHAA